MASPADLPLDPDLPGDDDRTGSARRPGAHWPTVGVVFVGGTAGGAARYAVTAHWATPPDGVPWPVLAVNTAGAFVLALVVVIAADVLPSRYLRLLLGTGFCGAFTTFSSVVVGADQLVGRHRSGTAAEYVLLTVVAGVAAAVLGMFAGRWLPVRRPRAVGA